MLYELNGLLFKEILKSGEANLSNHQKEINALNVFPVPDGDTGTNMSMTFTNGLKEAITVSSSSVSEVARALSKGLLMGARGNSGVITSQIFRGFYQAIDGKEVVTVEEIAKAFENGARVAYKAIMKPVEGTILTVIKEGSWYANQYVEKADHRVSLEEYFDNLASCMSTSLDGTPELLPVLKEVGVVDSGGKGLLTIIEGFRDCLNGNPVVSKTVDENVDTSVEDLHFAALEIENDEFGYCTEFIVKLDKNKERFNEVAFRSKLSAIGQSLVVVNDGELVKVHVHTLTPGDALNIGQKYGEFLKLKIENMQEQRRVIGENAEAAEKKKAAEKKNIAIITVCAGDGLHKLFKECRADAIISGGQTMNPSTSDFQKEIENLNADHIIIIPNNSNIIMAAQQARDLNPDKDIRVLETKSIPEGISALTMFNPEMDIDDNIEEMSQAYHNVLSGSITYAVKDTSLNGVAVKEGDFIGMTKKAIVASGTDRQQVIKELLDELLKKEDASLLTVIAGEGSSKEDDDFITQYAESNGDVEVDFVEGDQPVYTYLFGIE